MVNVNDVTSVSFLCFFYAEKVSFSGESGYQREETYQLTDDDEEKASMLKGRKQNM
jgi:hypothetical protein